MEVWPAGSTGRLFFGIAFYWVHEINGYLLFEHLYRINNFFRK
jgi:hypothetical protein